MHEMMEQRSHNGADQCTNYFHHFTWTSVMYSLTRSTMSLQKPFKKNWKQISCLLNVYIIVRITLVAPFRLRLDGRGDRLQSVFGPRWQPVVRLIRLEDMDIPLRQNNDQNGHLVEDAAALAEANMDINQHVDEEPLPGRSRKRSRVEDDEEEGNIKRLMKELEEFAYSDTDSYYSSSDVDDEDAGAGILEVNHVRAEEPLPGRSRKRKRDNDEEDERSTKQFRQWLADSDSDKDSNAPSTSRQ